ncbi:hypothetical protein FKW77_004840 [Venturia effusa]|uniref:Haloacid dehalogenase, type II n=1 Tax=Venturia effusa TaxID=50376 RepID=A0A517LK55_9PEZI|nr:hypothetical protein FKW77_004840 [Venturia effusa]
MAPQNKHVVFDVVGTCVSYENFFQAIESQLGPRLKPHSVNARLLGYAWIEAAEKEYTYLSLSGKYTPFFTILRSIFYRTLGKAGISDPRSLATDADLEILLTAFRGLKAQEGLVECFEKLREAGFTVWALTAGDVKRVSGYLEAAGASLPKENFVSCDEIGVGKPHPDCYRFVLDKFEKEGLDVWFAAAHMWDASAARRCGFKGAWASFWEGEPCLDIFGEMEVQASSLPELADGIVAYTSKK